MTQEKNLNMDTTIVATSSQTSSQTTPIDVKLLLCQLVIDAKEGNTWHDIYDKYINHPLVTTLHNKEAPIITNISEEELAAFVIKIINETVSSIDISETTTVAVKRPRGRQFLNSSDIENLQSMSQADKLQYILSSKDFMASIATGLLNQKNTTDNVLDLGTVMGNIPNASHSISKINNQ
ncbi:hypothetical protein C6P40_001670, partial [Pichia californica]